MKTRTLVSLLLLLSCYCQGQQLSGVEYFIDNDPGVSNGFVIPLQGQDSSQLTFSINTATLTSGLHSLSARVFDDSSSFSLTSTMNFIKTSNANEDVVFIEYFIDQDPGIRNGIVLSIGHTVDTNLTFTVNTTNLLTGLHSLYVRSIDNKDNVSISEVFYFVKFPTTNSQLLAGEYFFDSDPGHGMASGFGLTGGSVNNQIIPISIPMLSTGFHHLSVRVKDDEGWSLTTTIPFVKVNMKNVAFNRMEYFIDADPGVGAAITFAQGTSNPAGINLHINTSALSIGAHTIFIRSQDSCGFWSITSTVDFFKVIVQNEFSKMEYFIDVDPGFGGGFPIALSGLDTTDVTFQPNVAGLANGIHTLSVRSKSQVGSWSQTNTLTFFKYAPESNALVEGEYFFNDVLSPGQGTNFSMANMVDSNRIISLNIAALPYGINYFFFRSRDSNGRWSRLAVHPFIKDALGLPHLIKLEYFINEDPGVGQAFETELPSVSDTSGVNISVNITSLEAGFHKFFVRAYDSDGEWSITQSVDFVKYCMDSIALIDVFVPDSFYQAATNIRSNGTMNPVVTTFKSMEIDLLPGFEVPLGVQFLAENGDCPTDPEARSSVLLKNNLTPVEQMVCTCRRAICICIRVLDEIISD